ncbi:MAG: hypothetical protein GC154_14960 [bacterium]|nr:hypothetical protein [bacterium]
MNKKTINLALALAAALWITGAGLSAGAQSAAAPAPQSATPHNDIRMNFRGVPIDQVLEYLSQAAGFIIVKEVEVDGPVNVMSYQPLNDEEAVALLNTVLNEKGFAAVRNGRTLTIVKRDDAKQRNIPVKTGANPDAIPQTDEMVTQIIPVRYADATKLIENLQPLMPTYATMSANESSNAIVLTDTQSHVRRMVEIVRALDTSISSISSLRVFSLQYSDATELADVVNQLFQEDTSSSNRNNRRGNFPPFFGGPGGPGGRGGRGDNSDDQTDSTALKAASRVVAVADERSNSLVVSAPDELMPIIENMIHEIDSAVEDLTEIRVFKLMYADATETSSMITELFPDESSSSNQNNNFRFGRGGFFGGPGGPGGPGGGQSTSSNSERKQLQTTVRCVPDPRTNSLVVTASRDLMFQISQMIERLDANPAKKQQVYVYRLEHADVDNVAEILRGIFETTNTTRNRQTTTGSQSGNTLSNRTVTTPQSFGAGGGLGQ